MDVCLSRLGEGADSGTIAVVLVQKGEAIHKDQPILELENEKALTSVPSTADGVVSEMFVKPGDKLTVGQRILSLDTGGVDGSHEGLRSAKTETALEISADDRAQATKTEPNARSQIHALETGCRSRALEIGAASNANPAASPSIRKLARELGIDLTRVRGSERGGRIVHSDIKSYIQALQAHAFANKPDASQMAHSEDITSKQWNLLKLKL